MRENLARVLSENLKMLTSTPRRRYAKVNNLKQPTKYKTLVRKPYNARVRQSLVFDNRPMNVEKKNVDTFFAVTAPGAGVWSAPTQLNVLAQGNTAQTRVGRSVHMTSIQLRYNYIRPSASGPGQARILVIYDKQSNQSIPATLDILAADTSVSPLQLANSERFIVLLDELTDSIQSTSLNISGMRYRKIGLPAVYNGAAGTSGQVNTGTVWLYVANNDVATGTATSSLDIYARIRFTDI